MDNDIKLKQVEEFYRWLQNGGIPDGMRIAKGHQPELSEEQAFTVIWFLQEHLCVIPSHYEKCQECNDLFDTWKEGFTGEYIDPENKESVKDGMYCEHCVPIDIEII